MLRLNRTLIGITVCFFIALGVVLITLSQNSQLDYLEVEAVASTQNTQSSPSPTNNKTTNSAATSDVDGLVAAFGQRGGALEDSLDNTAHLRDLSADTVGPDDLYLEEPDSQTENNQAGSNFDAIASQLTPEFIASPLFTPARASRELANLQRQARLSEHSVNTRLRQQWELQSDLRQQINQERNDGLRDSLIKDFAETEVAIRQLNNQSRQQNVLMNSLEKALREKMQAPRDQSPYPGSRPPLAHYFQESSPFSERQQE